CFYQTLNKSVGNFAPGNNNEANMDDADLHQIPEFCRTEEYTVELLLRVPGPLYPRRKYKEYRLLTVEKTITLPFVPYPGLYVTLSKPHWRKPGYCLLGGPVRFARQFAATS